MRKLMWFAIGFLAACTFCAYIWFDGYLWCFGLLLLLAVVFGILCRKKGYFAVFSLLLTGCAMGFGWFWIYDSAYLSDARSLDGMTTNVTVTLSDYTQDSTYGTVGDGRITINGKTYSIRVYLKDLTALAPSDQIYGSFEFRYIALGEQTEPNSLRSEGIVLFLYQRGDVSLNQADATQWRDLPAVWRRNLSQLLRQSLPEDTSGFASALLLGERDGIGYATNTAFKVSGISHIIAVSGLHVSILFGLIYVLTLRKRYLTGIIGIPLLILFAAIVGFTPSITRACIMQILMLIAMMVDREYDPPTALAFSVLTMLIVNPMTAASVSFQLSVGCMVGIFLFYEPISKWLGDRKLFRKIKGRNFATRCKNWFISSVSVTISAGIITTPLVAVYFETVSLVGILTNLLTLWVVSFVFYGLLLVCGIGFVSTAAASVVGWVIGWPIRYVVGVAKILASIPLAAVYTKSLWIILWLALTYGLLTLFILSKRKRPLLFGCITAATLCVAMLLSWGIPRLDHYRMTVVDVGQGQCILLQSDGRTYMVDCGGSSERIAADQAAEYLLSQGIFRLDGIILTHYDADHAGGVENLLMRIPADALYLPEISDDGSYKIALMETGIPVKWIIEDTKLSYGKTKIAIFAPESTNGGNESGLCILFQREKYDILITGDRGQLGESFLLSRTNLPQLDVLVAGHHGSDDSTGEALLKKTVPNTVMISVGKNNPYGHPGTALLDRLSAWGCTIYRTDIMGTIIYRG